MADTNEAVSMAAALNHLAQAIDGMNKVPPPLPYAGRSSAIHVDDFLANFEKYCKAVYKNDKDSWLQILPTFLEGEAKAIVVAHGRGSGVDYDTVKNRLVLEVKQKDTLGSNKFADFFSASRQPGESLVSYRIRLESRANKAFPSEEACTLMVKNKFISSLPSEIVLQLNIQLGHQSDTSLDQVVRLATILESQSPKLNTIVGATKENFPWVAAVEGHSSQPQGVARAGDVRKCFSCGEPGHMRRDCKNRKGTTGNCFKCGMPGHFAEKKKHQHKQMTNQTNRRRVK